MKKNMTKISFYFWFLFSVTLFFHRCDEDNREKVITQIVQEWQGKEITHRGFIARSVVGAYYIRLLKEILLCKQ